MAERIVIALGGHALVRPGQAGTIAEQSANLREGLRGVVALLARGCRAAIVHGNGPQVGQILIRAEEARGKACDLPLDACVAQSQGEIGGLIQRVLQERFAREGIDRPVATLVTQVVVRPEDLALPPSKPIGPVLSEEQARALRGRGASVALDPGRGLRRVVASPRPERIVEVDVIRTLFDGGTVVIAAGGGGIPVADRGDGRLEGVEAVIDKDLAAAELAVALGADRIVNLTSIDGAKLYFGAPVERSLRELTVADARRYLAQGHFAPGSMGPKIEGAIRFLEANPAGDVVITTPENLAPALEGAAGTRVVAAVPRLAAGRAEG